jgi:outer membrane protein OmpU
MKNLLIATTALVATAGVAAAEINFSGGARFGATYSGSVTTAAVARVRGTFTTAQINTLDAVVTGNGDLTAVQITSDGTADALNLELNQDRAAAVLAFAGISGPTSAQQTAHALTLKTYDDALALTTGTAQSAASTVASKSKVHNRFTLNIDGTTESDSGVEFFARVRIRGGNTGDGATAASTVSAPRVGMTVGGITVAAGNINGALESQPGLYSGAVGLTGLGWGNLPINNNATGAWAWTAFSSGGGGSNGVEVIYSANGFGAHMSVAGASGAQRTAMNVSYKINDWTVALGHQSSDVANEDTTLLTVGGTIGGIVVGLAHADNSGDRDATRVNATFSVGAASKVTAYYTAASGVGREDAYGLGFTHSLGGATLAGGVANSFTGQTSADLGVRFNF